MDNLLKKILDASGISGYEKEVAQIMHDELKKISNDVYIDNFGNVIAKKGSGNKKIMIAAHMDEVGLLVKHVTKEGFIYFIKVGGIDDRILVGQKVIIKSKQGDVFGIIGAKPPHLQKDEEKKNPIKYEDMFIDVGCKSREEVLRKIDIGSQIVFEPNSGVLNDNFYYGKAVDNRVGCFALLKIFERIKVNAEIFAVVTVQEEVGLKGAKTASFKIDPDYAIILDTTVSGDTPQTQEKDCALKLGSGCGITIIEALGRGLIVSEKIRDILVETAKKNNIKYQMDIIDGGMTDGATVYMNKTGVPTGVISIPSRYIHAPSGVFCIDDLDACIELAIKSIEKLSKE
ncbi:MAG: M42 family metallopeptidase [Candidatus Omnitrophota bacterium]